MLVLCDDGSVFSGPSPSLTGRAISAIAVFPSDAPNVNFVADAMRQRLTGRDNGGRFVKRLFDEYEIFRNGDTTQVEPALRDDLVLFTEADEAWRKEAAKFNGFDWLTTRLLGELFRAGYNAKQKRIEHDEKEDCEQING